MQSQEMEIDFTSKIALLEDQKTELELMIKVMNDEQIW